MRILNLEIQIEEANVNLKLAQMKSNNMAYFARFDDEEENLISELITNEKEQDFFTWSKLIAEKIKEKQPINVSTLALSKKEGGLAQISEISDDS